MNQPAFLYPDATPQTVTATDTATGADPLNIIGAMEGPYWQPLNNTGSKELVLKFSAALAVDFVAILGRGLDGATVEVRGSTDDFATVDVQLSAGAALSAALNAAWRSVTGGTYSEIKLVFSSFSTTMKINHVAVGAVKLLPYFKQGHDAANSKPDGEHKVSTSGTYNGAVQQSAMAEYSLAFNNATAAKLAAFLSWKAACVDNIAAFFLVPDTDAAACCFCWQDKPGFSAPELPGVGLFKVATIKVLTRLA